MSRISNTKEKQAKRIKTHIERMPGLSTTVTKVLEACNRPDTKVPIEDSEEFFVGGLLHDLGKIPLTNRFQEDYVQAIENAKLSEGPVYRAENDIFEIDHGMVREMIAEKWNLDKKIKNAPRYHHQPEETGEDSRSQVGVISLANLYINTLELRSSGKASPEKERFGDFLEQAEIDGAKLSVLRDGILEKIEEAKIFMQVAQKG